MSSLTNTRGALVGIIRFLETARTVPTTALAAIFVVFVLDVTLYTNVNVRLYL